MRTHRGNGFRSCATLFAFATLLAVPCAAGAQTLGLPPPPPLLDVLHTTDGAVLRGRVLEIRLYQDVTIQLEDGSVRVVPWTTLAAGSADVESLRTMSNWRFDAAAPATVPFAPRATLVDDPLEPGPGRVPLRVDSDGASQSIGIHRTADASTGAEDGILCTTPCTLYVRPGTVPLAVVGSDAHARVQPIDVASHGSHVLLHAGSSTRRAFGIAMVPIGAVGVLAGMMLSANPSSTVVAGIDAGGLLAIGGIVMIVSGATMIRGSRPGVRSVEPLDTAMGFRF